MSRIRLLVAWLILLAIPLQGLAAASMRFCGPGLNHSPAQVTAPQQQKHMSAESSSAHDKARHGHAADVKLKSAGEDVSKKLPEVSHKCGVCASCCHGVAVAGFFGPATFAPLAQAVSAEPFVLIHARPAQVPDKPPHA